MAAAKRRTSKSVADSPLFLHSSSAGWTIATLSWSTCLSHPASPVSPKCCNKAHFQPETLWPHHRRAHQPSLASRDRANYIQGGDADVSCTALFRTRGGATVLKEGGDKTWFASEASEKNFFVPPHLEKWGYNFFTRAGYEQGNNYQYWIHWNLLPGCRINRPRPILQ